MTLVILCYMSQTSPTKLLRRANLWILCSYIEKFPSPGNLRFDATDPAQINLSLIFSAGELVPGTNREGIFSLISFFIFLKFLSLSGKKKLIQL